MAEPRPNADLGFNDILLAGVILLGLTSALMGMSLYLLSGERAEAPELEPLARVADEADFPRGAGRIVSWGTRIVLVVRSAEGHYAAVQGTSPTDGCILRWDPASLRIVSPCSYQVYDLRGNTVVGLATEPLQRYSVFVRRGVVYVGS